MLWGGDATDKSVEWESEGASESTAAVFSNSIISFSPPLDDVRPVCDDDDDTAPPELPSNLFLTPALLLV